jgi:hypothetical protein
MDSEEESKMAYSKVVGQKVATSFKKVVEAC